MRLFLLLSLPLGLFACTAGPSGSDDSKDDESGAGDDDGDGLTNQEEEELGLDPNEADTDGDGLDDPDELDLGTNPNFKYSVPLEKGDYVLGTCPDVPDEDHGPTGVGEADLDGNGQIKDFEYRGVLYEEDWDAYAEGDTVTNWTGLDAFGQDVSVYNFCGNYVMVSTAAEWCGPCVSAAQEMADEMEEMVDEIGNFTYFELLSQDMRGNAPSDREIERWHEEFGLDGIPVVGPRNDEDVAGITPWDKDGYIPSNILLSPDMRVISMDVRLNTRQITREIEQWEEDNG